MSQTLEIPDPLFEALQKAAEADGITPVGWIAARLAVPVSPRESVASPAQTLADLFKGRVGRIRSGGTGDLSERCSEAFTDYLQQKKQAGHL